MVKDMKMSFYLNKGATSLLPLLLFLSTPAPWDSIGNIECWDLMTMNVNPVRTSGGDSLRFNQRILFHVQAKTTIHVVRKGERRSADMDTKKKQEEQKQQS